MDLEEFRERMRRGERPTLTTLETNIEYLRLLFDASIVQHKKEYKIGGCVRLNLNIKSNNIVFKWLTSDMYDAYMKFGTCNEDTYMEPFVVESHLGQHKFEPIMFMPKGATREEIEWSEGIKFRPGV